LEEAYGDVAAPTVPPPARRAAQGDDYAVVAPTGAAAYAPARRPAAHPAATHDDAAAHPTPPVAAQPVGLGGSPLLGTRPPRNLRSYLYLVLLVALLPLAVSTMGGPEPDFEDRLTQTIAHHPESEKAIDEIGNRVEAGKFKSVQALKDALIDAMPGHRLDGAWLPRNTSAHWLMAILAGGAYFGVTILVFPSGRSKSVHLLWVGLFTGTVGILLLLGVQLAAFHTYGVIIIPRGIVGLLFWIVKLIGMSYRSAMDPTVGWFASFLGFTAGVGICEELCKALPLLWHYRKDATLDWRGACRWGFISGVGFGVSEGITYSSDFYNGIMGGDVYVIRFVSCVALHAVWSAAAGIMICRRQQLLQSAESVWGIAGFAIVIVAVPIVLHGAYDTLLKKDHDAWAMLVALASFAWLTLQVETMLRKERAAQAFGMPSLA
jgi:RsiW-degrading membrane proteinase PrsW (M82 family)